MLPKTCDGVLPFQFEMTELASVDVTEAGLQHVGSREPLAMYLQLERQIGQRSHRQEA